MKPATQAAEPMKLATQAAVATIMIVALAVAYGSRDLFELYMQEDHFAEWLTAALFAIGGAIRSRRALMERRPFDGLVAVFSFFVAGEEFSWGQRLIGYTPPAWFLSHNVQQEATLHNFAGVFGRPKWSLIAALVGYGLLLPLAYRFAIGRKVMDRIGATSPPDALAPWFAMTVVILVWYPLSYSGEWMELVASVLFLGAATTTGTFAAALAAGAMLSLLLAVVSARRGGGAPAIACAESEVANLLNDITAGAGTIDLLAARSLEKRVWTGIVEGDIDGARLFSFGSTSCAKSIASSRRRYAVDPWGSSYWVSVDETADGMSRVAVYSLGPNRRRDWIVAGRGDDIAATLATDPFAPDQLPREVSQPGVP